MECDLTNRDQYKQVELSRKSITSSRNWLYGLSWTVLRRRIGQRYEIGRSLFEILRLQESSRQNRRQS